MSSKTILSQVKRWKIILFTYFKKIFVSGNSQKSPHSNEFGDKIQIWYFSLFLNRDFILGFSILNYFIIFNHFIYFHLIYLIVKLQEWLLVLHLFLIFQKIWIFAFLSSHFLISSFLILQTCLFHHLFWLLNFLSFRHGIYWHSLPFSLQLFTFSFNFESSELDIFFFNSVLFYFIIFLRFFMLHFFLKFILIDFPISQTCVFCFLPTCLLYFILPFLFIVPQIINYLNLIFFIFWRITESLFVVTFPSFVCSNLDIFTFIFIFHFAAKVKFDSLGYKWFNQRWKNFFSVLCLPIILSFLKIRFSK